MARPRTINPDGNVHRLAIPVADHVQRKLEAAAKAQHLSVAEVVRRILDRHFNEHPLDVS